MLLFYIRGFPVCERESRKHPNRTSYRCSYLVGGLTFLNIVLKTNCANFLKPITGKLLGEKKINLFFLGE